MLPDQETISYVGTPKLTIFKCAENDAFAHVLAAIIEILVEKQPNHLKQKKFHRCVCPLGDAKELSRGFRIKEVITSSAAVRPRGLR